MDSTVSCFVDDTQIFLTIKDNVDTKTLQNDLHKLYIWADTNNVKFNTQFKLLRYEKKQEIKTTAYKLYDNTIIDTQTPGQSLQENTITVFGPRLIAQLAASISQET